jgi:hypothetical protein
MQWFDVPVGEGTQDRAERGGARTPANRRPVAPCRSRFMSSTLSAPATMPPTSLISLAAGKTPAPSFGTGSRRNPSASAGSPHRSASRIPGSSPPYAIRFGSSNHAETSAAAWEDRIAEVPRRLRVPET